MHTIEFHQIMQDARIAHAIGPIVRNHHLGMEEAAGVLRQSGVARAQNVAEIATSGWSMACSSQIATE
ncbi:MAG: hypothetical protein ABI925_11950 [Verrucomicrobiota bacterium]